MAACQSEIVNNLPQAPDTAMGATKSRRAVLAGVAAAIAAAPAAASASSNDPIYPIWRRWRDLEEEGSHLSATYQATWDALPDWAKVPRVLVLVGKDHEAKPSGNLFYATTPERIREILGFDHPRFQLATPAQRAAREAEAATFDAELAEATRAAEAERERTGLTAIERRLDDITDEQSPLLDQIEQSPSGSPVAIAAKIDAAFGHTRNPDYLSDLPHSLHCSIVRSVYHDLPNDMRAALASVAAMEGTVGDIHGGRAQA